MHSVNMKAIEPSSTIGNILKKYEIIIKAILMSNAWHELYLTKYGTFGLRANPANKIINNKKLPKGIACSNIAIGEVINDNTSKKEYLENK